MNAHTGWQAISQQLPGKVDLPENVVHVWRVWLENPTTHRFEPPTTERSPIDFDLHQLERLLTIDERSRADAFRFVRDRQSFIIRRGILRTFLGRYLRVDPAKLRFSYNPVGKPALIGSENMSTLKFNLSYSAQLALFAFSWGGEIGVDVEYINPDLVYQPLVESFFAPQEQAAIQERPDNMRRAAFYACWTRKEAFVKAQGSGLQIPLDRFVVSIGKDASLLRLPADLAGDKSWRLEHLDPAPGYVGALAVSGDDWEIQLWK